VRIDDETNLEQLRAKARVLLHENERLSKKVVDLLRENLSLKGMSPEQLQQALFLLDQELNKVKSENPDSPSSTERRGEPEPKERKPKTGHGPREQKALPIVTEVHDLDEADKKCPTCGGELCEWEKQADETEEVDVVERRFVMKKHVRRKYRCKCGSVEMALMPPRLVPGGRYSNAFAVEVAASKYIDHLPLERQVRIMEREGLIADSQTLWDQVAALGEKLRPAWERLKVEALKERVLGFDESGWKVMTKGSRKSWAIWELSTRKHVYFEIAATKGSEDGARFLEGFKGIALGDAAVVHQAMAKDADYEVAYCWAHSRRKFIKAEANDPIRAKQFIEMVQELYRIEDLAPPGPEGDELRRKLRKEQSAPQVAKIREWMIGQRFLPESDIGTAIKYVATYWDGLKVFLEEPEVPIDNNRTERGFRGPALGRNNFYGSHSRYGTEIAAILYSLVECAKLNKRDPKAYLKVALEAALDSRVIPLPYEVT
jgi:transposase